MLFFKLFENELNLNIKYKSFMDCKYLLSYKDQYYLVFKNVGNFNNIKTNIKSSKL